MRADRLAENVAQREWEYRYVHTCHSCYDYLEDEPLTETNHKGELICSDCIDKQNNED